jgi:lipoprotein-anchoring transpeptidase ErfK/SrfK
MIVAAEVVVLLGVLGVWGYRATMQNLAASGKTNSRLNSPNAASTQTAPGGVSRNTTPMRANLPTTHPSVPTRTVTPAAGGDSSALDVLRSPAILVEKSKQRLTVFDGGRIVKRYPASTGRDAGDKMREGDYRTPEGEFYVCVRNAKSKYTRALGLSYPNASNALRGLREGLITQQDHDRIVQAIRRRRQPPWNTPLGGQIMIHGDRRGGRTTQGCIALEDGDILELFPRIPLGTRVMITP